MSLPVALQHAVVDHVEHCYCHAESQLNRRFARPVVEFTLKGLSAGVAHLQQNRLRFNPVLLAENAEAFLQQVVPHEVAHLLVWQCFGKVAPHGKQWQAMMQNVFGIEPITRHRFDVSRVAAKTFPYRCACRTHALTIRRHNKVIRGQATYSCRYCGQNLQQNTP